MKIETTKQFDELYEVLSNNYASRLERIVCYRTEGGQIALLKSVTPNSWGWKYAMELLDPKTRSGMVFKGRNAKTAISAASTAGREIHAFLNVTHFLEWATQKQLVPIPFEKGSEYYLSTDLVLVDAKAGEKVIVTDPGSRDSCSVRIQTENGDTCRVSKLILNDTPHTHTVHDEIQVTLLDDNPFAEALEGTQWSKDTQAILKAGCYQPICHNRMSIGEQAMKFEMIPTLNGRTVDDISTDELISIIAKTERDIEKLTDIKTQSAVIQKRVERMKENLVELVNYIDKERKE